MTYKSINDPKLAAAFAAAFTRGDSFADMEAEFGVTISILNYWRQRLELPPRTNRAHSARRIAPRKGAAAAPVADQGADPGPPVVDVPKLPAHPGWQPLDDIAVMQTGGRHAELAKLAKLLGKTSVQMMARWHRLRAA